MKTPLLHYTDLEHRSNFDCMYALNREASKSGSHVMIKEAKFDTPIIQSTNIFLDRRSPSTMTGETIPEE